MGTVIAAPLPLTLLGMTTSACVVSAWWRPRPRLDVAGQHSSSDGRRRTTALTRRRDAIPHRDAFLLAAASSVVTMLLMVSPVLGVAGAGLAVLAARLRTGRRTRDQAAARAAALPELIDVLVALVHAGLTPPMAWRRLAASTPPVLHDAVIACTHHMDRGLPFADALDSFVEQVGPAAHGLVDSLATAERYGLPLAPVLDRLSVDAAARRRRAIESRSRQLPVRLSFPLVVCTLPSFVLLGIVPVLIGALRDLPRR